MKIGDIDETGQWLGSLAIGNERVKLNRKKVYIDVIHRIHSDQSRFDQKR